MRACGVFSKRKEVITVWHLIYTDAVGNLRDLSVFSGYMAVATLEVIRRYGFTDAVLEWKA
jgi:hypothetical protein